MIVNKYNKGGGGSGSGSTYTAGEYIQIENDVISVTGITPSEYLTTADTQDFVTEDDLTGYTSQQDFQDFQDAVEAKEEVVASALTEIREDMPDMTGYYTKAETDAAITSATQDFVTEADITAATSPIQTQLDDIERVTATALTELHDSILELSGATGDFATEAYVDAAITGATQGYATEAYVNATITSATQDFVSEEDLTGYTSQQDFQDFQDAISVKEEVIASAITQLHDEIVDISGNTPDLTNYYTKSEVDSEITAATKNMVTTGDIQNFVTSGDVATQISAATQNMVESTSVSTIWSGTQAQYDAISTKDPNTFYIIKSS